MIRKSCIINLYNPPSPLYSYAYSSLKGYICAVQLTIETGLDCDSNIRFPYTYGAVAYADEEPEDEPGADEEAGADEEPDEEPGA